MDEDAVTTSISQPPKIIESEGSVGTDVNMTAATTAAADTQGVKENVITNNSSSTDDDDDNNNNNNNNDNREDVVIKLVFKQRVAMTKQVLSYRGPVNKIRFATIVEVPTVRDSAVPGRGGGGGGGGVCRIRYDQSNMNGNNNGDETTIEDLERVRKARQFYIQNQHFDRHPVASPDLTASNTASAAPAGGTCQTMDGDGINNHVSTPVVMGIDEKSKLRHARPISYHYPNHPTKAPTVGGGSGCGGAGGGKASRKDPAPVKAKKTMEKVSRLPPLLHWEGPPPDDEMAEGWPEGWVKRIYVRRGGATKGSTDSYWFTPVKNFKLRSITEVKRFMKCLTLASGDEDLAWQIIKGKA